MRNPVFGISDQVHVHSQKNALDYFYYRCSENNCAERLHFSYAKIRFSHDTALTVFFRLYSFDKKYITAMLFLYIC